MIGDRGDLVQRLRLTLPTNWFAETAPILDGILTGFATAWTSLYDLLQFVIGQARIRTATGDFLDLAAQDFLSASFPRRLNENDDDFRSRLLQAIGRTRATKPAIIAAAAAAGYRVSIFEAAQPGDTGAYNISDGLAWNTVGGWGSLKMPLESLIVASSADGAVEDELWKNIAGAAPAGGTLWMRTNTTG